MAIKEFIQKLFGKKSDKTSPPPTTPEELNTLQLKSVSGGYSIKSDDNEKPIRPEWKDDDTAP